MFDVRQTSEYSAWFETIRDTQARARILARVRYLSLGNAGDVKPVGEGVSELRIHYGPGYRVYFVRWDKTVVVLVGGGDKSTQRADIAAAKAVAKKIKE